MRNSIACIFILLPALASCGSFTPRQVAEPSQITVHEALQQVAVGLKDMQNAIPDNKRTGLLVDEVQVQFNVAASSQNTTHGNLSISNVPLAGLGGNIGGGVDGQNVSGGNRGNTITITFKNAATADMSKSKVPRSRYCGPNEPVSHGCIKIEAITPPRQVK